MMDNMSLIDRVIEQIREDIVMRGDVTAIEELLKATPGSALQGYLPDTGEYFTTVRAEVYITLRSERPLQDSEVQEVLSEMHYEFGDGEGYGLEDGESVYVCATRWEENTVTRLNGSTEDI